MAPSASFALQSGGTAPTTDSTCTAAAVAADEKKKRRRRLSRKEQKARRRQKKSTPKRLNGDLVEQQSSSHSAHPANGSTRKPVEEHPRVPAACAASACDDRDQDEEKRYLASYVPTPIPTDLEDDDDNNNEKDADNNQRQHSKPNKRQQQQGTAKSLGKWFPSAMKLKSTVAPPMTTTDQPNNNSNETTPPTTPTCSLLLFYQYVTPSPPWSADRVRQLVRYLVRIHAHRRGNLAGRIRIAPEGLNATVTAVDCCLAVSKDDNNNNNNKNSNRDGSTTTTQLSAAATLRHFARDLIRFDPEVFGRTDFKYTDGLIADRHFAQLTLLPVRELVYYGLDEQAAPLAEGGLHVSPEQFHRYLAGGGGDDDDPKETVVIDVRNHYEAAIGRFDGQQQIAKQQQQQSNSKEEETTAAASTGRNNHQSQPAAAAAAAATYIDPKMRKSTDFPAWLARQETRELLSNKRVLLYCTGGIRCERASAHLKHVAAGSAAAASSQSKPKAKTTDSTKDDAKSSDDKKKEPSVDNSDAIPPPAEIYQLQGGIERYLKAFPDGGFWRGKNYTFDKREAVGAEDPNGDGGVVRKRDKERQNTGAVATEDCRCVLCGKPWDRYIGKQHCRCCGVPVLCCDGCLSSKKTTPPTDSMLLRCPLCVEQNVTVPAQDVVYTNNGVAVAVAADTTADEAKAAPSVCKWGGGHATEKKRKRRLQSRPCRFGADCTRPDCFFSHPSEAAVAGSANSKKKKSR